MKKLLVLLATSFAAAMGTTNPSRREEQSNPVSLNLDSIKGKGYSQTPEGPITQADIAEPGKRTFTSFDEKGDYKIINGKRVYFENPNPYDFRA